MTDSNTEHSTSSDVTSVLLGLLCVGAGAMRVLFHTNPASRALGALTLMFGTALAVAGWRGRVPLQGLTAQQSTRRSGLVLIGVSLMAASGTIDELFNPDQTGRVLGTLVLILAVAGLVAGGLSLWHARKRRA